MVGAVWLWARREADRPILEHHRVPVAGLPAGTGPVRIAHLTDVHGRSLGARRWQVLRWLVRIKPDLVAVTGDVIDRGADLAPAARWLGAMAARFPVVAVLGNHDHAAGVPVRSVVRRLQAHGVAVLINQARPVRVRGVPLWLIGVDDPALGRAWLARALAGVRGPGVRVLLAHTAGVLDEAQAAGIDVYLCGDTHGGQVRLPGLTRLIGYMAYRIRHWEGLHRCGPTWLYVNRGLGTSGVPVRFRCPPEVAVLELVPQAAARLGKPHRPQARRPAQHCPARS